MQEFLKKAALNKAAQVGEVEVDDAAFCSSYPALAAFLLLTFTEDKQFRELSSVKVFAEGGCWKACLVDHNAKANLFVTIDKPQDVFKALDKALRAEKPDWRKWFGKKSRK